MTLKTRHQKNNKKCSRKHHGKSKKKKHIKKTQRKKHSKKFYQIDGGSQNNDITRSLAGPPIHTHICPPTESYQTQPQADFEKLVFDRDFTITLPNFNTFFYNFMTNKRNIEEMNITMNISKDNKNITYTFKFVKKLGKGAYGTVILLKENKKNPVKLAVKIEERAKTEPIMEQDIANDLHNNNCDTIEVRHIMSIDVAQSSRSFDIYIMNPMKGDLNQLVGVIDELYINDIKRVKLNIAREIKKQIACLFELNNNYVYTDLKLANVLYDCSSDVDNIRIHLGDLGGAVMDNNNVYISTYPPYEYIKRRSKGNGYLYLSNNTEGKKQTLAWQMGIVLLSLIGSDSDSLLYNLQYNRITKDESFVNKGMNLINEYYGKTLNLGKFLHWDPDERTKFNTEKYDFLNNETEEYLLDDFLNSNVPRPPTENSNDPE